MDDMLKILIFIVSLMGAGIGMYAAMTVIALLRRRLEGSGPVPSAHDIGEIHTRLAALEQRESRVSELEERLDFAERLLAQHHESESLPEGQRTDRH